MYRNRTFRCICKSNDSTNKLSDKMSEAASSIDHCPVIGKCKMMCPPKEYEFRKKHHLFHALEKAPGCHCVKEFHRSAAGEVVCHPENLRPMNVLMETADYLFSSILFVPNFSFVAVYDFIFDRLRSIRQDAVIQELQLTQPHIYIALLEKCINFYCYAAYRKAAEPDLAIDVFINTKHTRNCLETILETHCQIGFEFKSTAQINSCLRMLSVHILMSYSSSEILADVLMKVPRWLRDMQPLKTCIAMCHTVRSRNYLRFMRLTTVLCHNWMFSPLCWVCQDLGQIRNDFLKMLSASHSSKIATFSNDDLRKWLILRTEKDLLSFCTDCGLQVVDGKGVRFTKDGFKAALKPPSGCYVMSTLSSLSNVQVVQFLSNS